MSCSRIESSVVSNTVNEAFSLLTSTKSLQNACREVIELLLKDPVF